MLANGDVAAIILEPIPQNIGESSSRSPLSEATWVELCDKYGTVVLIFSTRSRRLPSRAGGYQALPGVTPDLCTFGKAVANGYPMGVVGGRREIGLCAHPGPKKRASVAGTYNGHPVNRRRRWPSSTRLKTREAEVHGGWSVWRI